MGANAGAPHDNEMQTAIVKAALEEILEIPSAGQIVPLPYEYTAKV